MPSRAAALLILGVMCLSMKGASSDRGADPILQLGAIRPCEGRLAGISFYAPYNPEEKSNRRVIENLKELLPAKALRVWLGYPPNQAFVRLLEGNPRRAAKVLEAAAVVQSEDTRLLNALTVTYFELNEQTGDPTWIIKGLAAADRAVAIKPTLPESLFNRALGLEKLFLFSEAIDAWQAYLSMDFTTPWAEEARVRVQRLRQPSESERWERVRHSLDASAAPLKPSALRVIVAKHRQAARQYAEESLLGQWGEIVALQQNPEADRLLDDARTLGRALADTGGDPMVLDAVMVIDRASAAQRESIVESLASAHYAFARGLELYRQDQISSARQYFDQAFAGFHRGGSPMGAWTIFYLAVCDYHNNRYQEVLAKLALLRKTADLDRYPVLLGRTLWMTGLVHFVRTNLRDSLSYFHDSLGALERANEPELVAGVRFLLAENYFYSGEQRHAWEHRYEALRLRSSILDPRRLTNILYDGADAARAAGYLEVAHHFHNEQVKVARHWGLPSEIAQALLHRSRTRGLMGDRKGATKDLARAQASAKGIAEPSIRYQIEGDILLASAELKRSSDPAGVVEDLSRALEYFSGTGFDLDFTQILLARARGFMQLGNDTAAERDLASAVELHRGRLSLALRGKAIGPLGFDAAQVYRAAIDFEARRHGRISLALDYAEEARARALIDNAVLSGFSPSRESLVRSIEASHPALKTEQLQTALPAGTRLVEFLALGDDLVAWTIESNRVQFYEIQLKVSALVKSIDKYRSEIMRGRAGEKTAEQLYLEVAAPLLVGLEPGSRVVFIPDGPLHRLPFSALRDPNVGRYLVETFDIALAPSASLYVASIQYRWPERPRLLAVGSTQVSYSKHPWLPPLPGAETEARVVASLYPRSRLLLGREATSDAVLANLGKFEIVHFAGHSILNQEFPLESSLILAAGMKSGGNEIQAFGLYGRSFERTRLVVLSSCSSAGGDTQAFQGLIGFARAFIVNGVPAAVGTLFDIEDRVASEFLMQFHQRLREDGDPVRALSSVQRQQLLSNTLQLPKNWAAFQIVGGFSNAPSSQEP